MTNSDRFNIDDELNAKMAGGIEPVVWFNPACSKCRTTQSILAERGVDASYVDYQLEPPSVADLQRVQAMLGATNPRVMARTGEVLWGELELDDATDEEVLEALAANPSLIERPIVVVGDKAVIARPPDRVLELIEPSAD
ncbi:MAG: hypothetical protein KDB26_00635 [Microthrixaceae bacterium]|nr:hypothetical protein [Microthrixaceae bacterium]